MVAQLCSQYLHQFLTYLLTRKVFGSSVPQPQQWLLFWSFFSNVQTVLDVSLSLSPLQRTEPLHLDPRGPRGDRGVDERQRDRGREGECVWSGRGKRIKGMEEGMEKESEE